ncbi:uroporphyrinogen-III synthase [Crocinitomicaceae bacterium]|nr:uroporphyrinogen-III synthase [Crocinitomicaceae bacterium]
MLKSIFISKHSGETLELQQFADASDIQLTSKSFLEFKPVAFELPSNFDVLFFGSPRAVVFFQSRHAIPNNVLLASVGGKTTGLLQSMGHEVAFSGENKGSISEVAEYFQKWLGDRKVLFPVSTKSLGTISKGLPAHQALHVECYETVIIDHQLNSAFDAYVFTSPSNVEGFFAKNALPKSSTVIAWGESTHLALSAKEVTTTTVLSNPSISELINVLSISGSPIGK